MTYSDPEQERTYQREYARTEKRKAVKRKYNQTSKGKASNNASMLRWHAANREKLLEIYKRSDLKRYYGLTLEQREAMWVAQGKKCAACGSTTMVERMGSGVWGL